MTTVTQNGREILAKDGKWGTYAKTFANLTQAKNAANKAGTEWIIVGRSAPFTVERTVSK